MGTSPITLGVGNGAALRLLLLLIKPAQGAAPPAQDQLPRARQAELVICDQTIEKLVAWLKLLENHTARHDPADPMASYDLSWIWRELDITDRRK